MHARFLSAFVALTALSACVDLKPAPAPPIRWLSLSEPARGPVVDAAAPGGAELAVSSLRASDAIRESLVRRRTGVEIDYDEGARWVEPPERMVERALRHELFRRRGLRSSARASRRLEVELISFEESMVPRRRAVVGLSIRLTEDGSVVLDRRIDAARPLRSGDAAVVAAGLTEATDDAVSQVADLLAAL